MKDRRGSKAPETARPKCIQLRFIHIEFSKQVIGKTENASRKTSCTKINQPPHPLPLHPSNHHQLHQRNLDRRSRRHFLLRLQMGRRLMPNAATLSLRPERRLRILRRRTKVLRQFSVQYAVRRRCRICSGRAGGSSSDGESECAADGSTDVYGG
jgi:hypothetical protein